MKNNKGITLIALVITIIVMLILVAVTISMAVNGGLFNYAGKAVSETNNALKAEQQLAEGRIKVGTLWYNNIDDYLKNIPSNDQEGVKLIQFKIDETTYNAEEDMTWGEWVASDYNTINATLDDDLIKAVINGEDYWVWQRTAGAEGCPNYGMVIHSAGTYFLEDHPMIDDGGI